MTPSEPRSVQDKIAQVKEQLANARARVPKHDVPAALIAEMDDLDDELAHLRSLRKAK